LNHVTIKSGTFALQAISNCQVDEYKGRYRKQQPVFIFAVNCFVSNLAWFSLLKTNMLRNTYLGFCMLLVVLEGQANGFLFVKKKR